MYSEGLDRSSDSSLEVTGEMNAQNVANVIWAAARLWDSSLLALLPTLLDRSPMPNNVRTRGSRRIPPPSPRVFGDASRSWCKLT